MVSSSGGSERPQSAAAVRKAQLDRMREQEQRKRAERIGGAGMAVAVNSDVKQPAQPEPQSNGAAKLSSKNKGMTETEKRLEAEGIDSVFDPTANNTAVATNSAPAVISPLDLSDIRSFVDRACPRSSGTVQCQIVREKSTLLNLYPQYRLYLKNGMRFLLAARKRKKSKTPNYVISLESEDMSKHSKSFIGKVRSNFIGTEFTIFDKGISPTEAQKGMPEGGFQGRRQELGFCTYESNILGAKGPRKMHVLLPKVYEDDTREEIRPSAEDEDGLRNVQEEPSTRHKTMLLHNKPPKWNEKVAAFVLNFNGRVTMASVKNFQLVLEEDAEEHVVLQFGKVGKDEFTMDYRWPMSPLQAFAICLGSLDNKLACE